MTYFIRWLRVSIAAGLVGLAYEIVPPDLKPALENAAKKLGENQHANISDGL